MKYKEGDKVTLTGTVTGVGSVAGEPEGGNLNVMIDGGSQIGIMAKDVKPLAKSAKTASEESHVAEVPAAAPGVEQTQNSNPKTKTKTAVTKKKK